MYLAARGVSFRQWIRSFQWGAKLNSNRRRHIAASPGNVTMKHSKKYSKTHLNSRISVSLSYTAHSYRNSKLTICEKPLITSQRLHHACTQELHKNSKAGLPWDLVLLAVYLSLVKCKRGCIAFFVIIICMACHAAEVARIILHLESPAF